MPLPTTMELLAGEIGAALGSGVVKQGVAKSLSLLFPTAKVFSVVLVGDRNCVVQHENFLQEGSLSRAPVPIKLSVVGHSVVSSVGVEASALTDEALQSAADIKLMSQWGCRHTVAVPIPGVSNTERGSNCSLGALALGFPQECVTTDDKAHLVGIAKLLSHRVLPLIAAMVQGLQRDGIIGAAFCCSCKGVHSYQRMIPPSSPISCGGSSCGKKNLLPSKATAAGGRVGSLSNGAGQQGQSGGLIGSTGVGGTSRIYTEQLASALQGVDSSMLLQLLAHREKLQQQKQGSAGSGRSDLPARSQISTMGTPSMRRHNSVGASLHQHAHQQHQQQPWHAFGSSGNLQAMAGVASPGKGSAGTIASSSAPLPSVSSTGSLTLLVAAGGESSQQQPLLPTTVGMWMAPQAVPQAASVQYDSTCTAMGPMPNTINSYGQMQQQQQQEQQGDGVDEDLAPTMMHAAWASSSANDAVHHHPNSSNRLLQSPTPSEDDNHGLEFGPADLDLVDFDLDLNPFQLPNQPMAGGTSAPTPSMPTCLSDPLPVPVHPQTFHTGKAPLPSGNAMPSLPLGATLAPHPLPMPQRGAMHAGMPCQGSSGSLAPLNTFQPVMLQQPNAVPLLGSAVPADVRAVAERFWSGQQLQVVLHYLECEEVDSLEVAAAVPFNHLSMHASNILPHVIVTNAKASAFIAAVRHTLHFSNR